LPWAKVEEQYAYRLEASGGVPPYSWSVVGFTLPDGLALSEDGLISGAALVSQTEPWASQFTVRATDSLGQIAHKNHFLKPRAQFLSLAHGGWLELSL
jgi:hypothetical protein